MFVYFIDKCVDSLSNGLMYSRHWMLAVIYPWSGLVHWLDPAGVENKARAFAQTIINKYLLEYLFVLCFYYCIMVVRN